MDDDEEHEDARALIDASGADIRHGGTRAYYSPSADYIRVPEQARFETTSAYHATMLHELAHWTGHEARLARNLTGRFGSEGYAAEELVAELTAAFLCAELGVPGQLQHESYIASWIRALRNDQRAIFTAARMAQQAADYLFAGAGQGEGETSAQDAPGTHLEAA